MMTELEVRAKRAEVARLWLAKDDSVILNAQRQAWFYCLSEVLGKDRLEGETIEEWMERSTHV